MLRQVAEQHERAAIPGKDIGHQGSEGITFMPDRMRRQNPLKSSRQQLSGRTGIFPTGAHGASLARVQAARVPVRVLACRRF